MPQATRDDWLDAVAKALRLEPDAALDRLRSTTYDGITIEPLYTAADAPVPLLRPATRRGPWDVRQVVDAAAGPGRAVEELERGATSIVLDLTGVDEITAEVVAGALDGVLLDVATVVLDAGARWREAAAAFEPIGRCARPRCRSDRRGVAAPGDGTRRLAALGEWFGRDAGLRVVTVDATRYHDAGASDAQQLGCAVAVLVEYVRALGELGVDPDTVLGGSELRLAATARPVRHDRLDPRPSPPVRTCRRGRRRASATPPIHAVTSTAMMTRYDPWVNALRSTVACFAAGVAGADAVTVLPHDGLRASRPSSAAASPATRSRSSSPSRTSPRSPTRPAGRGTSSGSPTSSPRRRGRGSRRSRRRAGSVAPSRTAWSPSASHRPPRLASATSTPAGRRSPA